VCISMCMSAGVYRYVDICVGVGLHACTLARTCTSTSHTLEQTCSFRQPVGSRRKPLGARRDTEVRGVGELSEAFDNK